MVHPAKPRAPALPTSGIRNIRTLGRNELKRDVRVGQLQPKPPSECPDGEIDIGEAMAERPARPELVPDEAVTVDNHGNVREAGPFTAMLDKLDRGGEPRSARAARGV